MDYFCNYCSKQCVNDLALNQHLKDKHRIYLCQKCLKEFASSHAFEQHNNAKHNHNHKIHNRNLEKSNNTSNKNSKKRKSWKSDRSQHNFFTIYTSYHRRSNVGKKTKPKPQSSNAIPPKSSLEQHMDMKTILELREAEEIQRRDALDEREMSERRIY